MIGLKRGTVMLCEHDAEWETEAQNTVSRLKQILGNAAKDIQHVGSTAIRSIRAKPILDIAVAMDAPEDIFSFERELKEAGFYYRPKAKPENQILFAAGSLYDGTGELQTHFVHVVRTGSREWADYLRFRDYLNRIFPAAREYELLKLSLAAQTSADGGRERYTAGKNEFIAHTLRKALLNGYLGRTAELRIDRPLGSVCPEQPGLRCLLNCGHIPGVTDADGAELKVYLLGVEEPVTSCAVRVIGAVHRRNDAEDRLVAAPEGRRYIVHEIEEAIRFGEQDFDISIEAYYEKSCGTVLYTKEGGELRYLLLFNMGSGHTGFPKGHVEKGENELETALRETWEETSIRPVITEGCRLETLHRTRSGKEKTIVYFPASYTGQKPVSNPGFERCEYYLLSYDEAYAMLSLNYAREVLRAANEFLTR